MLWLACTIFVYADVGLPFDFLETSFLFFLKPSTRSESPPLMHEDCGLVLFYGLYRADLTLTEIGLLGEGLRVKGFSRVDSIFY